jgi:hypothetical protein
VHLKGDINATADNAHVFILIDKGLLHLVLDTLTHQWQLPTQVINALLTASGLKKGRSAIFNAYMASYQHDWVDMSFTEQDYRDGYRDLRTKKAAFTQHDNDDDLSF